MHDSHHTKNMTVGDEPRKTAVEGADFPWNNNSLGFLQGSKESLRNKGNQGFRVEK